MDAFNLDGAVALVTGSAGGIGRATIRTLTDAGACTIGTDLAGGLSIEGAAAYHQLDVTDEDAWRSIASELRKTYGRLDILVNNAGICLPSSIADTALTDFRRTMQINVEGVFLGMKMMQDLLSTSGRSRRGGSAVVNVSSIAGLVGSPSSSAYSASKGAVRLLSKSAAAEYARLELPIRVNSVHPGVVDTPMMDGILDRMVGEAPSPEKEGARQGFAALNRLGRFARPEEIASGILYLCAPASSFMTAAELVLDGGRTGT